MVWQIMASSYSEQAVCPQGSGLGLNFQTLLLSFSIKHQLFRHEEEKNADDTKIEPTRENMTRKK